MGAAQVAHAVVGAVGLALAGQQLAQRPRDAQARQVGGAQGALRVAGRVAG
jgi:hypothetical protein